MTEIQISPFKSVQENANEYFTKAKKSKAKLKGLEIAMKEMQSKVQNAEKTGKKQAQGPERKRKREWFEKFRWFFTSQSSLLCIAGKDRQSNEILVKKQMQENDLYFHADIQGAAHCILKDGQLKAKEKDMKEAAKFAAVLSKAWSGQLAGVDVYSVKPEQVSKQAQTGESLGSGAFMIYGNREWFRKTPLEFAIGIEDSGRIVSGPSDAVKGKSKAFAIIEFGKDSKSDLAKKLKGLLGKKTGLNASLDELMAMLPGEGKIKNAD